MFRFVGVAVVAHEAADVLDAWREQQNDREPDPGEEFLEGCAHQLQPVGRLGKRGQGRAQADIDRPNLNDCFSMASMISAMNINSDNI